MKKLTYLILLFVTSAASAQLAATQIPFELFGDHIFVKVSVDGSRPLDMIFDTGSGITVIDDEIADELGLEQKEVVLNEGTVRGSLIKHNQIAINDYQMEKNINVYSTNLDHLEISLGREFDGIVGYDFMRHHVVRINYNEQILQVYERGEGPSQGIRVPIELVHSIPVVKGTVVLNNGEPHDGTFFIMSGAGTTLDFNTPYANEWDVIHKTGLHYSYPIYSISEEESIQYEGHIQSLTFGGEVLENLPVGISQATYGIHNHPSVSGIIGNQILSMYNITYDYDEKMLYMIRNRRHGKKLAVNCSGIHVQLSKDKERVLIHRVFENSPASEANIQEDAELVSINGQQAMTEINMADIKSTLKKDGDTVELVIKENGQERSVTLALRSLLSDY